MVQLTIVTDNGAVQCRLTLAPTTTVEQLLHDVWLVKPELRGRVLAIRNDARGAVFSVGAASLQRTLQQAQLTAIEATTETLVFSEHSNYASAPQTSLSQPPTIAIVPAESSTMKNDSGRSRNPPLQLSSSDPIAARILQLFRGDNRTNDPGGTAAVRPPRITPSSLPAAVNVNASRHTDPEHFFDPEALSPEQAEVQRRLYEVIQQRQIDENLANALEYTPEIFATVVMLYVPCTINQVPLKAFVDSGAQRSIINRRTAERCGLMRLLDPRMRGVAIGVGRQVILGQIHMAPVNIAGLYIPFAFSVLEKQEIDVIIGLDQLKRHQMVIDLKNGCLTIGDAHVNFLPESEIPKPSRALEIVEDVVEGRDVSAGSGAEEDEVLRLARHAARPEARDTSSTHRTQQPTPPASPAATAMATAAAAGVSASAVSSTSPPLPAPMLTPEVSTTTTATGSPVVPEESVSMPQTEREKAERVESFMSFTGITERVQARELLEAVGWDADAAAALYFDAE